MTVYLTIFEIPRNANCAAHRFVTRKRGDVHQGLVFATGRCWRKRGAFVLCAAQWLWRWAAVAGSPLGLGPGLIVHGRPLLASRIAVAFPRLGPPEAQCFWSPERD